MLISFSFNCLSSSRALSSSSHDTNFRSASAHMKLFEKKSARNGWTWLKHFASSLDCCLTLLDRRPMRGMFLPDCSLMKGFVRFPNCCFGVERRERFVVMFLFAAQYIICYDNFADWNNNTHSRNILRHFQEESWCIITTETFELHKNDQHGEDPNDFHSTFFFCVFQFSSFYSNSLTQSTIIGEYQRDNMSFYTEINFHRKEKRNETSTLIRARCDVNKLNKKCIIVNSHEGALRPLIDLGRQVTVNFDRTVNLINEECKSIHLIFLLHTSLIANRRDEFVIFQTFERFQHRLTR